MLNELALLHKSHPVVIVKPANIPDTVRVGDGANGTESRTMKYRIKATTPFGYDVYAGGPTVWTDRIEEAHIYDSTEDGESKIKYHQAHLDNVWCIDATASREVA